MANRFFNPNEQFCDPTGTPYAGGSLTFYASGTTTPLNTYQDKALSIANTNPVVLDSAGRAGNVFLQNLAYKVVLADVNSNVIWTFDPVYASDFSTVAQFQSGSGSPNGVLAGTAGSSGIPASSYWDFTNQILYVCTQTGTASTAVWTAINAGNAGAATAVTPPPQGYLTTVSGTPIITSDSTGVSNVFYTPYIGNLIPVYNGTSFTVTAFSEIGCALVSAHAASTIYDFFVFNNSGVLTLVTGPAWSNSTAGSCSRGSGASTTQLTRINGLLVNAVSMLGRNGSTTYTIPANQATYVGSLWVDTVAGQVTCHRSYGQSRKWGVWNAYNRVPLYLKAGDSTASWNYSGVFHPSNSNTANSLTVFTGLPEEYFDLRFNQNIQLVASASNSQYENGIGWNSITAASGLVGNLFIGPSAGLTERATIVSEFFQVPSLGINTVTALESGPLNNASSNFFGTETAMVLSAQWRG